MPVGGKKYRFALDHNFPQPVVAPFSMLLPHVELVPISTIDPLLAKMDDWEIFIALATAERHWDGFITGDADLLSLPKEMTVLSQTSLTLVVTEGEGHSPIRAVGLLLCHLNHICHQTKDDLAQIWTLRTTQKNHEEPRAFLEKIAGKKKMTTEKLIAENKLPQAAFRKTKR